MDKRFAIVSIIGTMFLTLIWGWWGFWGGIVSTVGLWHYSIQRGLLFIRSYVFLAELHAGKTVPVASYIARSFNSKSPALPEIAGFAFLHIKIYYEGRQLPLIAEARRKGFQA